MSTKYNSHATDCCLQHSSQHGHCAIRAAVVENFGSESALSTIQQTTAPLYHCRYQSYNNRPQHLCTIVVINHTTSDHSTFVPLSLSIIHQTIAPLYHCRYQPYNIRPRHLCTTVVINHTTENSTFVPLSLSTIQQTTAPLYHCRYQPYNRPVH